MNFWYCFSGIWSSVMRNWNMQWNSYLVNTSNQSPMGRKSSDHSNIVNLLSIQRLALLQKKMKPLNPAHWPSKSPNFWPVTPPPNWSAARRLLSVVILVYHLTSRRSSAASRPGIDMCLHLDRLRRRRACRSTTGNHGGASLTAVGRCRTVGGGFEGPTKVHSSEAETHTTTTPF
jgi:hypothetical protein